MAQYAAAVGVMTRMRVGCPRGCWQEEMAPTTGQHHFQSYFELKNPRTFQSFKDLFLPFKPHVEVAKGTAQSNLTYCTKVETRFPGSEPVVWGDFTVTAGTRAYGYLYGRPISFYPFYPFYPFYRDSDRFNESQGSSQDYDSRGVGGSVSQRIW